MYCWADPRRGRISLAKRLTYIKRRARIISHFAVALRLGCDYRGLSVIEPGSAGIGPGSAARGFLLAGVA